LERAARDLLLLLLLLEGCLRASALTPPKAGARRHARPAAARGETEHRGANATPRAFNRDQLSSRASGAASPIDQTLRTQTVNAARLRQNLGGSRYQLTQMEVRGRAFQETAPAHADGPTKVAVGVQQK
jgi:hypothetical protein